MKGFLPSLRCFLTVFIASMLAGQFAASQNLEELGTANGPTDQRINFVWIAEGYDETRMSEFRANANAQWSTLLATEPYKEYRTFLNGFMIPVVWQRSVPGAVLQYPQDYDTIYNMVSKLVPEYSIIILVSASVAPDTYTHANQDFVYAPTSTGIIGVHEITHQFADVGDEYACTVGTPERPNLTVQTDRNLLKWRAWVEAATPIPTPSTPTYSGSVGLFENVLGCGVYRSRQNCVMGSDSAITSFCEVCRETIALQMYRPKARVGSMPLPNGQFALRPTKAKTLRPIQSFSPASSGISLSAGQTTTFSIQKRMPATATHPYTVRWYLDGTLIPGATSTTYVYTSDGQPHQIAVHLHDDTPFVRTDLANVLTDSVFWTVNDAGIVLTSPAANSTIRGGTSLAASVTSRAGAVSRVEFYAGNTLLATVASAPYTYLWRGVPEGAYMLRARAVSSVSGVESSTWSPSVQLSALGWTFLDLGAGLPAGYQSEVFGMNDQGQMVGRITAANGRTDAFRTAPYSSINPASDNLTAAGPWTGGVAKSINNAGVVVGNLNNGGGGTYQTRAFMALAGASAVEIHVGPRGETYSGAEAISPSGTVGGWLAASSPDAFVFPPSQFYLDPGSTLRPSIVRGINSAGTMVGAMRSSSSPYSTAFRATAASVVTPGLSYAGINGETSGQSEAWGINSSGEVVGNASFPTGLRAFRTAANQSIELTDDLGTLGGMSSSGFGINDAHEVVGSSLTSDGSTHAFHYLATMSDLSLAAAPTPNWTLTEARAINANSEIAGTGLKNGLKQGFLLRPKATLSPPTVQMTGPIDGSVYTPGPLASLVLSATAGNLDASITLVEFFANGVPVGSDTVAPYYATWRNIPSGVHSITARATDARGVTATSAPFTVIVNNLPTVQITSPAQGATFLPGGQPFTVTATAADTAGGSIARVNVYDVFHGVTVLVGSSTTAPYSIPVSGLAPGPHTLIAEAVDNVGTKAQTSRSINVVGNLTIALTGPASGAVYSDPGSIPINFEATATAGIQKVQVFQGSTLLADRLPSVASSPYFFSSWTWANVPPGNYSLTVKVIDTLNQTATSTAVSVRVSSRPVVQTSSGLTPYTEGAGPVVVDPNVQVTDLDNTTLAWATAAITSGYSGDRNYDLLEWTPRPGIVSTFDPPTGTLLLTGTATVAEYIAALRSVTFRSTSHNPRPLKRITFQVNDGSVSSTIGIPASYKDVQLTLINDPPTLNNIVPQTIPENNGTVTVSLAGISPGPQETQTAALLVTATSSNPSLIPHPTVNYTSQNTFGSISFTPTADSHGSATVTVQVNDQQPVNNLFSRSFVVTVTPYTITLQAIKSTACEALSGLSADDGTIVVSRSGGNSSASLNVSISLGGTAQPGGSGIGDYTLSGPGFVFNPAANTGTLSFGPNVASAILTLSAVDDVTYESDETVLMNLVPSSSYVGGTGASLTIKSMALLNPATGDSSVLAYGINGAHKISGATVGSAQRAATWSFSSTASWGGVAPSLVPTPAGLQNTLAWSLGNNLTVGIGEGDLSLFGFATQGASSTTLPALGGSGYFSGAYGINSHPTSPWILGFSETIDYYWHASYWVNVGGSWVVHDLGIPVGGTGGSTCYDANDLPTPQIAGDADWPTGWVPLVWLNPTAPPRVLPFPGSDNSGGTRGINNASSVVGYTWDSSTGSYFAHPVKWVYSAATDTYAATFLPLPPGVPANTQGVALKINNSDVTAGFITDPVNGDRAVIWIGSQPYILNNMVPAAGVNFRQALDISDASEVVGKAEAGGLVKGFYLVP